MAEPLRQVQLWMRLWSTMEDQEKADVRRAWRRILPKVLLGGVRWNLVSGVMHATVAVLGQMGWAPVQPGRWLVENRSCYADLDDEAPEAGAQIQNEIRLAVTRQVWRGAAAHHLGGGLADGIPSLAPAREARKWLVRHHHAAEVRALDMIVCGGAWCGGREHIRRKCHCGQPETPWHRYWGCGKLDQIKDHSGNSIVASTQWLADWFQGELGRYECLWGRAITPHELCDPGPCRTADDSRGIATPGFVNLVNDVRVAYSDGSGGPAHAPKGAPAVGSGLAVVKWSTTGNGKRVEGVEIAAAPVPGRQTVPRAELWAACIAANSTDGSTESRLKADAAYVVDTTASGQRLERCSRGANGDLWAQYAQANRAKPCPMSVSKVRAHALPAEALCGRHDLEDFIGNHIADAAAGAAAESSLAANAAARKVEAWERRTFLIARRLAAIEVWHWTNDPEGRYIPPEPLEPWAPPGEECTRESLREKVACNGHVLRYEGDKVVCSRCHRRRGARLHKYWTNNACKPVSNGPFGTEPAAKRPRAEHPGLPHPPDQHHHHLAPPRRWHDGLQMDAKDGDDGDFLDHDGYCDQFGGYVGTGPIDGGYDPRGSADGISGNGDTDMATEDAPMGTYQVGGATSSGDPWQRGGPGSCGGGGAELIPGEERLGIEEVGSGAQVDQRDSALGGASASGPGTEVMRRLDGELSDDDDPFGYNKLNFDEGQAVVNTDTSPRRAPAHARVHAIELGSCSSSNRAPMPPPVERSGDPHDLARPHAVTDEGDMVSARERRRLVLEQRTEKLKRRRIEAEVTQAVWDSGKVVVDAGVYFEISPADAPPPFEVHGSHMLVVCGGFTGCARCGRVVAYQGHGRFAAPCRGHCPTGSQRPIRRLIRGQHPHHAQRGHLGPPWPDGSEHPVPRRFRPCVG